MNTFTYYSFNFISHFYVWCSDLHVIYFNGQSELPVIILHFHTTPHICSYIYNPQITHKSPKISIAIPLSFFFLCILLSKRNNFTHIFPKLPLKMEAINMKMFVVAVIMMMAISAVKGVAAADAPAPAPASDATVFVPAFLSSFVALAFALLF